MKISVLFFIVGLFLYYNLSPDKLEYDLASNKTATTKRQTHTKPSSEIYTGIRYNFNYAELEDMENISTYNWDNFIREVNIGRYFFSTSSHNPFAIDYLSKVVIEDITSDKVYLREYINRYGKTISDSKQFEVDRDNFYKFRSSFSAARSLQLENKSNIKIVHFKSLDNHESLEFYGAPGGKNKIKEYPISPFFYYCYAKKKVGDLNYILLGLDEYVDKYSKNERILGWTILNNDSNSNSNLFIWNSGISFKPINSDVKISQYINSNSHGEDCSKDTSKCLVNINNENPRENAHFRLFPTKFHISKEVQVLVVSDYVRLKSDIELFKKKYSKGNDKNIIKNYTSKFLKIFSKPKIEFNSPFSFSNLSRISVKNINNIDSEKIYQHGIIPLNQITKTYHVQKLVNEAAIKNYLKSLIDFSYSQNEKSFKKVVISLLAMNYGIDYFDIDDIFLKNTTISGFWDKLINNRPLLDNLVDMSTKKSIFGLVNNSLSDMDRTLIKCNKIIESISYSIDEDIYSLEKLHLHLDENIIDKMYWIDIHNFDLFGYLER